MVIFLIRRYFVFWRFADFFYVFQSAFLLYYRFADFLCAFRPAFLLYDRFADLFTHSIEAYVATAHTDLTDCLAVKSAQMVFENLVDSYKGSETARKTVHTGQDLAGMSFSNALLGIVHSLARKVGVTYGVTHGR